MNENNGKGIFYGVIGVATLIVAIIGATFAYFSASQEDNSTIKGEANTDLASGLSISVSKVKWQGVEEKINENLVPAKFGKDSKSIDTEEVNKALTKKCISGGFTGCHVWRIEAESAQDLTAASIYLDLKVNGENVEDETKWSYAIFTTDSDETSYNAETGVENLIASQVTEKDTFNSITGLGTNIHDSGTVTKDEKIVYYLLVYLANDESTDQTESVKDEKGKYTGTVTFFASGTGQVKATFVAGA